MKTCAKAFCLLAVASLYLAGHALGQSSPINPATGLQESYGPDTFSNIVEQNRKVAEAILLWDKEQSSSLLSNSFHLPPSPSDAAIHQALLAKQARATQTFSRGEGDSDLFRELYNVNGALGDDSATVALFQRIARDNPVLAQDCEFTMEPLLVRCGDYQLCLDYIGNPEARFQLYCSLLNSGESLRRRIAPSGHLAQPQDIAKSNFVCQVCCLVEILVGTGHETEAEYLREKAMAVLSDARIQSVVIHAEKHLKNPKAIPSAGEMETRLSPIYLAGLEPVITFPPLPPIPPPARIDPAAGLPVGLPRHDGPQ